MKIVPMVCGAMTTDMKGLRHEKGIQRRTAIYVIVSAAVILIFLNLALILLLNRPSLLGYLDIFTYNVIIVSSVLLLFFATRERERNAKILLVAGSVTIILSKFGEIFGHVQSSGVGSSVEYPIMMVTYIGLIFLLYYCKEAIK
jgi:exosortase/archaeosortase